MQIVTLKVDEMKVSDLVKKFDLLVFSGNQGLQNEITGGYVSDLLSDVMGNASEGEIWITLQTHQNVMAIASLKELAAVILVKGLAPDAETLTHSNQEGIPVLGTKLDAFAITGMIFSALNK